jgi:uncharacterized protein (DUF1499 family)
LGDAKPKQGLKTENNSVKLNFVDEFLAAKHDSVFRPRDNSIASYCTLGCNSKIVLQMRNCLQ